MFKILETKSLYLKVKFLPSQKYVYTQRLISPWVQKLKIIFAYGKK